MIALINHILPFQPENNDFIDYGTNGSGSGTFDCNAGASEPECQSVIETDRGSEMNKNESDDNEIEDEGMKCYWEVKVNNGEKVSNQVCIH